MDSSIFQTHSNGRIVSASCILHMILINHWEDLVNVHTVNLVSCAAIYLETD